ncbi:MAG: ABC transporter ATP-binding protein [Culicoidibacterales bacterium]
MRILTIDNLTKTFGGLSAVSDVSIALDAGELVGLIGPNGAGKTTFFNLLTGVYVPTSGDVNLLVDGKMKRLNGEKPYNITAAGMARTFQNIRLFGNLSVLDNVLISMHAHSGAGVLTSIFRLPKYHRIEKELKQEALRLLEIFDLAKKSEERASSLPYGDQRCLEIVRALATKPKILFLDEPAAGMNPQETENLTKQIRQIQQSFNITVLLIEHDMSLVMGICDRIYVLEYGRLIACGTPDEIKNDERVIRAYLGEDL